MVKAKASRELTDQQSALAQVLIGAREEFGQTVYGAAKASSVHHATIGELEGRWGSPPAPERISLRTVCSLVKVYWPVVQLEHFIPDTELRFAPRDYDAARRLKGRAKRLRSGARPQRRKSFV